MEAPGTFLIIIFLINRINKAQKWQKPKKYTVKKDFIKLVSLSKKKNVLVKILHELFEISNNVFYFLSKCNLLRPNK